MSEPSKATRFWATRYAVAISPEEAIRTVIGNPESGENEQAKVNWALQRSEAFKNLTPRLLPYRVKVTVEVEVIDESEASGG